MDFKHIKFSPEVIQDVILYILVAAALCLISKYLYDWKEKKRLAKEFAEYQQKKADER